MARSRCAPFERPRPGNGRRQIDQAELEAALAASAEPLKRYLAAKIPPRLRRLIAPEDILQEAWITAFHEFPRKRFVGGDSVQRWIASIATQKLLQAFRRHRQLKRDAGPTLAGQAVDRTFSLVALVDRLAVERRTPSREAAANEAVQAVRLALAGLAPDRREAICMRHIDGRSLDQIAEAMNKTVTAVNNLLSHGLRQLRMHLGSASKFFSDPGRES